MKIVYVITRSDVLGGASIHLLDLAKGVKEAGNDVVILIGGEGIVQERAREYGLECIGLKNLIREINLYRDILGFFELRKLMSELSPDIIHLHSAKAGILGRMAALKLNSAVVFTAHGWSFTEGIGKQKRFFYKFIEQIMARFSDRIITVSNYDRRLALRLGVGNKKLMTTIHNGVSVMPLTRVEFENIDKPVKLIMVARFEAPKNQFKLLEALHMLAGLNWELDFVGDGPNKAMVVEQAKCLGILHKIHFHGECQNVDEFLNASNVFVLLSNFEGFPLTIIEAMRAGLPVIASSVGGVPEAVIDHETGFLVERDDTVAVVEALKELIESQELRTVFGINGRKRFESEFTYEKMLDKTLDVYSRAIG